MSSVLTDQESNVTADLLEYAAGEDVFNNSVHDQENTQLQIEIDLLAERSGMPVSRDIINSKLRDSTEIVTYAPTKILP